NHASVAVVTAQSQYGAVLDELRSSAGSLSDATRFRLAQEAFRRTAQYDAAIASYLSGVGASESDASARNELFPAALRFGAARAATVGAAMALAKASDPVSIYGGIVGVNRILDAAVVQALAGVFVEILFAPSFAPDALEEIKRTKKKCRVFEISCDRPLPARLPEYRGVLGGLLVQTTDLADLEPANLKTVSKR